MTLIDKMYINGQNVDILYCSDTNSDDARLGPILQLSSATYMISVLNSYTKLRMQTGELTLAIRTLQPGLDQSCLTIEQ